MPPLRLRPLRPEDEREARAAHAELEPENFPFLLGWNQHEPWAGYLSHLESEQLGLRLADGRVPSSFLVAEVEGKLVGRVSIRHQLNEFLAQAGGHVGYCVRPGVRRRGYATEILRQGLIVARAVGIENVLVTCDEDNLGSIAVIERLGGTYEDSRPDRDGSPKRRYWIT